MTSPPRARQRGFLLITVVLVLAVLAAMALMLSTSASLDNALVAKHSERANLGYVAEAGLAHAKWQLTQNTSCTGYTNLPSTAFGNNSYTVSISPSDGSPVSISAVGTLANGTTRTFSRSNVKAYQIPATLILQPDASDGKDAKVTSFKSDWNYGAVSALAVNQNSNRSLLAFDVSGVPASARIVSATLELYTAWSNGSVNVAAHRLTTPWLEGSCSGSSCGVGGATWTSPDGITAWTNAGGDYTPVPESSVAVGASDVWKNWDVTNAAGLWHTGATQNHGLALIGTGSSEVEFASSDHSNAALHPKLTISYSCECGVDCIPSAFVCDGNYAADVQVGAWDTTLIGTALNDVAYVAGGVTFNGVTVPADGGWAIVADINNDITVTDLNGALLTTFSITPTTVTGFAALHYIANGTNGPGLVLANVDTGLSTTEYIIVDPAGAIVTSWNLSTKATGVAWLDEGSYQGHFLTVDSTSVGELFDESGVSVGTLTLPPEIVEPGALVHLPDGNLVAVQDASSDTVWLTELSGTLPNLTATTVNSFDVSQFGISNFDKGIGLNPKNCNYALLNNSNETLLVNQSGAAGLSVTFAPVEDAHIYQSSIHSNYGSATLIRVGENNVASGKDWHSVVKFDGNDIASSLPIGATVTAATLRLYQENAVGTSTVNMDVHEVTADWTEGTITWNNFGGSFNTTAEDTASVVLGTPGWTEWSLPVTLITDWLDFPADNFGVLVEYDGDKNRRADFVSRDHADTTRHPQLVIEYTEP